MGRGRKRRKQASDKECGKFGCSSEVSDECEVPKERYPRSSKRSRNGETSEPEDGMAYFDYTSPKRLFESLINPKDFNGFFENYWEKKPLLINRKLTPTDLDQFHNLFSKDALTTVLKNSNIQYERDINIFRYKNGKRQNFNEKGRAVSSKLEKIIKKEKVTVQFHQPQRFQDSLWQLMEMLESFFGCLVGANVYITPGGSQGLPPHHDDIEAFVLQLEGQKRWRLYKPITELPRTYSDGLSESEIGEPTHTIILDPGDMLYFPRGTVHQADTPNSTPHSTHITISTYQHHSWGDYMMSVFPSLIEEAMNTDIDFRRGLPINFIKSTKISKTDKVQSVLGILLSKLVKIRTQKFLMPDSMVEDFMKSRLPPFQLKGKVLRENIPDGTPPDLGCKVRLKHPDHVCFLIQEYIPDDGSGNGDDDDEEESDDDEGGGEGNSSCSSHMSNRTFDSSLPTTADKESLVVHSSLFNNRISHMMGSNNPEEEMVGFALRFPKYYLNAVSLLKSSCDHFTNVKDIPLPNDDDRVNLIRALWSSHLLEVIPSVNRKGVKSTKLD